MEASPAWERGTVVKLFSLAGRPELNETAGVVAQFDEARGRYAVTVEVLDSKPIPIKQVCPSSCLRRRRGGTLTYGGRWIMGRRRGAL